MNTKLIVILALAAGFLGGLASRYAVPAPVYAQAPALPQEGLGWPGGRELVQTRM